jgi:hypothetical protein
LPQQSLPSEVVVPGLMDGLENVNRLASQAITRVRRAERGAERTAASKSRLRVAARKAR